MSGINGFNPHQTSIIQRQGKEIQALVQANQQMKVGLGSLGTALHRIAGSLKECSDVLRLTDPDLECVKKADEVLKLTPRGIVDTIMAQALQMEQMKKTIYAYETEKEQLEAKVADLTARLLAKG